jgi:hypothetical protein
VCSGPQLHRQAPGPFGHRYSPLGVVDLDRVLDRSLGVGRLACEEEDVSEVLVRASPRAGHVGRVGKLTGLAREPLGFFEAASPRENLRLYSPRENLGVGVVACTELQAPRRGLEGRVEVAEVVEHLALNAEGARQP